MARIGLSEQQVFEAAEALLNEGQGVTVSAVRERLGSGSYSTINTHLGKWREAEGSRKPADIPDIPPSVDTALRHVWALAWKESQERTRAEREGLDSARRDMERGKKDMEAEIARLEALGDAQGDEIKKLEDLLAEQSKALSQAQNEKQALSVENARLDERVKAAENRAGELSGKLEESAKTLKDQEREAAKMNSAFVRLEEKTGRLERELAEKTQALQESNAELSKAGEAASRQAEDSRKALTEAAQSLKTIEIENARLGERAAAAEKVAAALRGELDRLHAHVQELAEKSQPARSGNRKKGQAAGESSSGKAEDEKDPKVKGVSE